MATSSSTSLNGISTGVDTTALINAIVAQKGTGVTRLKAQRTANDAKTTALNSLSTELSALSISMLALQDKFNSRTVTSSDLNNAYVTATGKGVATGNYDVSVHTVATKGRISATLDANGLATNLAVASPSDSVNSKIFTPGTPAKFAIQGTDGVVKTITMTEGANTLNGLATAINASGAGVAASVVNTGKGTKPYQLVLTAKDTGTGTTQGIVSIYDITKQSGGTAGAPVNNIGILAGTETQLTSPPGGVTPPSRYSGATATDATFSLNGIELTRSTNVVKDAADGMTFTLKQGGQTGTTTLTVAPDKGGATTAMQDFITKYNQLVKDYKTASTSAKNADGSINAAPLANDASSRAFMASLRTALLGTSAGMPSSNTYKTLASMGVSSQGDGTLNMNIIAFQSAMDDDLTAALNLFKFAGTSTSQNVAVKSGGAQTATGNVDFAITSPDGGATLFGTLTQNGVTTAPIQVVNGTMQGTGSFTGLALTVTGTGSGTLTLARGSGQAAADLISSFTGVSGGIKNALDNLIIQDKNLDLQIASGQARLNTETANLKKKFAEMEATVGAMKAAAGSLSGA